MRHLSLAAVAATACLGAAALPTSASAAVTASTSGSTATLTSDDASDIIVLSVDADGNLVHTVTSPPAAPRTSKDWDSSSPGTEEKVAAAGTTIAVNGGGGGDAVNAAPVGTAAERLLFDGGPGNDVVLGTDDADQLEGGDGDDRVVGNRGGDDMEGGAGNDALVWNNGDGSDVVDGDAGTDGVEVNGAATQDDAFAIGPGATGRVRLDRTNLGLFTLDIGTTERLSVNGLGGDDTLTGAGGLAPLVLLLLDGGPGKDTLTGGDGHDLLQGGEDTDKLTGGAGDDRLVGGRGNDTMAGGDGDDTLVWNNGDNNDKADGDAGHDVMEVNGAPGAGDAFTVRPEGTRARLDRTNLVPFFVDISAEVLDLDTLGGDDTLAVTDGAAISIDADGGPGNDTLTAADADDALDGGSGNDALTGGGGIDAIDGSEGDDTISARDGAADLVRCAGGTDRGTADREDVHDGCETWDVPAAPPVPDTTSAPPASAPPAPVLEIRSVRQRRRTARVAVRCTAARCQGVLALLTARPVRLGRLRAVVQLGQARYDLAAGQSRTVTVRLPARFRALLPRRRGLAVRAVAHTRGGTTVSRTGSIRR